MAAHPSIDPAGFLHEHLAQASPDLLRSLLTTMIDTLMSAEADTICGADYGRTDPARVNQRNGLPPPRLRHPHGHPGRRDPQAALWLVLPGLAARTPKPRRSRAEAALNSVVATCYLLGVSTRRMEKLVDSLGITRLSKSQVSAMARDLDEQVSAFRTRPLDTGPYLFVAADAHRPDTGDLRLRPLAAAVGVRPLRTLRPGRGRQSATAVGRHRPPRPAGAD